MACRRAARVCDGRVASSGSSHGDVAVPARDRTRRNVALLARLQAHAAARARFGYRRLHILLGREGLRVNHKRVYRLYRAAGLQVRRRRRKRLTRGERVPLPTAERSAASAGRWTSRSTRWPTAAAFAR